MRGASVSSINGPVRGQISLVQDRPFDKEITSCDLEVDGL